ncbi:hypothetical protein [Limosilactobacillus fastidiosus]|uniref:hypothetical protein n=1 Tax=Limosilactobacillus fastidiosus TaxID=2759855 RepID=UPI001E44D527|nr:hypothetical protein [Limosilactobacillus fastidiosus]MCD7084081.1 hypothetical protein [Limosilactobacillus fastidiosus]
MAIEDSKKTEGDDWKSTVNLIDVNYATELKIDPFLEEYKAETGRKLPENFEDKYDDYIFNDDKDNLTGDIKEEIKRVYKFKKNIYYAEDGRRINITSEDRKEMKVFQNIRGTFENIDEMYDRVAYSYKNLISNFISNDDTNNPNTVAGAFLVDGKRFLDYLEEEWLKHNMPEFQESWKRICTYIYDTNLGYRLCYNLRNYDQHPRNHTARQIINEMVENLNENRVEYYLNVIDICKDNKVIRKKHESDRIYLQKNGNNEFSRYARNYMINITALYNLALTQFLTKNIENIKNIYSYLCEHNFNRVMIKSVDDCELKVVGVDYADDVISTVDIDDFLHRLENKGIINKQSILDIRNGNRDTPEPHLTAEQIVRNIIKERFLYGE